MCPHRQLLCSTLTAFHHLLQGRLPNQLFSPAPAPTPPPTPSPTLAPITASTYAGFWHCSTRRHCRRWSRLWGRLTPYSPTFRPMLCCGKTSLHGLRTGTRLFFIAGPFALSPEKSACVLLPRDKKHAGYVNYGLSQQFLPASNHR